MDLDSLTDPGFILYFPIYALATDRPGVPKTPVFNPGKAAEITPVFFEGKGSIILLFTDEDLAQAAAEEMAAEGLSNRYPVRIEHTGDLLPLLEFFQSHRVQYVGVDFDLRRRPSRKGAGYQTIGYAIQQLRAG